MLNHRAEMKKRLDAPTEHVHALTIKFYTKIKSNAN